MLVDECGQDLLAQLIGLRAVGGARPDGRRRSGQGARDVERLGRHGEVESKVPVPGVAALQREEAEFSHGQAEVFELLDVETHTGRNGRRDEAGQDLIEYTLLMAFIALASAAIFVNAGGSIAGIWNSGSTQLSSAATAAS